jgi:hypothetical protein
MVKLNHLDSVSQHGMTGNSVRSPLEDLTLPGDISIMHDIKMRV